MNGDLRDLEELALEDIEAGKIVPPDKEPLKYSLKKKLINVAVAAALTGGLSSGVYIAYKEYNVIRDFFVSAVELVKPRDYDGIWKD